MALQEIERSTKRVAVRSPGDQSRRLYIKIAIQVFSNRSRTAKVLKTTSLRGGGGGTAHPSAALSVVVGKLATGGLPFY